MEKGGRSLWFPVFANWRGHAAGWIYTLTLVLEKLRLASDFIAEEAMIQVKLNARVIHTLLQSRGHSVQSNGLWIKYQNKVNVLFHSQESFYLASLYMKLLNMSWGKWGLISPRAKDTPSAALSGQQDLQTREDPKMLGCTNQEGSSCNYHSNQESLHLSSPIKPRQGGKAA